MAVAWEDEGTRRSWKRARRISLAWLVVGLAALIGFTAYASEVANHSDRLVASGVHVKGTVLDDPPFALRCGQVPVSIRFPVDGQDATYRFYVDGCSHNGLHKGDSVDVYYAPSDPSDFAVNGRASESPLATLLAIVGLVAGAFFVAGAGVRMLRERRVRRALHQSPWQMRPAAVHPYRSPWTRGRDAIALLDEDPHPVVVTQPSAGRSLFPANEQSVSVAGTGPEMYVLRADTSNRLVLARRPRSQRAIARAATALRPVIG